jgi:hypothetical protein
VTQNTDVATGNVKISGNSKHSTKGPASVFHVKNEMPEHPPRVCYFWDMEGTCFHEQIEMLRNGTAITENYVMVGYHVADGEAVYY